MVNSAAILLAQVTFRPVGCGSLGEGHAVSFKDETHWAALRGMENICLQAGIPFELLFPEQLEKELNSYSVLIMPGVSSISEKDALFVRDWVGSGGGLYVSGRTSICDETSQKKDDRVLADVFGKSFEEIKPGTSAAGIRAFKKGCVCYTAGVPEKVIFLDDQGNPAENPQRLPLCKKNKFKLPDGYMHISTIIRNLSKREMPIEIIAPISTGTAAYLAGGKMVLHILNYEPEVAKRNINIRVNTQFFDAKSARVFSPDHNPHSLSIRRDEQFCEISLPSLEAYSFIEFRQ